LGKRVGRVLSQFPPLREMAAARVMWLEYDSRQRLLDVGCGNGKFLVCMRNMGWKVAGVEPDAQAAAVAQHQYGIQIHPGPLEQAGLPEDSFDVVTMNHVIEHLSEPLATLVECRRVMKNNARLVVVTPNTESWGCRIFGSAWLHWDTPRHLFLFSPQALRACAEQAQLRVEKLFITASLAWETYAASSLFRQGVMLSGGYRNYLRRGFGRCREARPG